jgi:hypothetical protein
MKNALVIAAFTTGYMLARWSARPANAKVNVGLVLRGKDLVAVIRQQEYRSSRVG